MSKITIDKNNRRHAGTGGYVGPLGEFAPGQFLPESEEESVIRVAKETARKKQEYREKHKPFRLLVLLAYAEEKALPHGADWKFSWKKELNKSIRFGTEVPSGWAEWDKKQVCYVYPRSWEEFDQHVSNAG
jgi:hypothetical protein